MKLPRPLPFPVAAGLGACLLTAVPAGARAEKILLLTSDNTLVTVESASPAQALATVPVTGLAAGESLVGLDVRPRDGSLVAVSSASRLYNVNAATGEATPSGAGPFTPALSGTRFGFNFNPTVDRIRLVSDARQDLRLNPDTGGVAGVDGTEAYAATDRNAAVSPAATGAAYTNNGPNATVTQLFILESAAGVLALQNPPNSGTLNTVGALGIGANVPARGFDISNLTERGYANFTVNGVPTLYAVNLATGAATGLGTLPSPAGDGVSYVALTVPYPNVLRNQRAGGTVSSNRPIFADFTVGSATNPAAGSGAVVRVLIRGLGPSIGGVTKPRLEVFRATDNTSLATVEDANGEGVAATIEALGLPANAAAEPATLLTLPAGSYYARLSARSGARAGSARIEIYELD